MTEQLTLAPSHAGDPIESRIAASRVNTARQYELVLLCLLAAEQPLTDDQIAERTGLLRHSAGTRRGVAVKQGHVERAGRGTSALGNPAATWVLTVEGVREALRARAAA